MDAFHAPPCVPPIHFTKITLGNSLDVIVRRQATVPIVAVNLWYHVGSKNEERRQRGYAHLFEHLMFEGSQHYPGDFFKPLQPLGAGINGSTSSDRTNYFVDLPTAHLELALAMESDRMANLLPALTDDKLRIQKAVVKNEYRQNYANRPYGQAGRLLAEALYPPGHPYSWLTIGVMEDVEAATLAEVESFFDRYYVPANASLCIVGDVDIDRTLALAQTYFGPIRGGTSALRPFAPQVDLPASRELVLHDRVELDRLYQVWPTVAQFGPDDAPLSLLADILARGRSSRLYRRLVVELELSQSVSAHQSGRELAGSFSIVVTQRPGRTLDDQRHAVEHELNQLARDGPTTEELERVRNGWTAGFIFALDNIGGFGGVADRLNAYNIYQGDPGRIASDLERFLAVSAGDIAHVADRFLAGRPRVALSVLGRSHQKAPVALDRAARPASAPAVAYAAPVPEIRVLACGTQVWLLPRRDLPIVAASVVVPAGAGSHGADVAGLASVVSSMLDEGTSSRSAYQLAQETERLGTSLSTSSGWDGTFVHLQCLNLYTRESLDLAADILNNPTFPQSEWRRLQAQTLASLRAERDSAESLAQRALLRALYPQDHPYSVPVDGTEEAVAVLSRDLLATFHRLHFQPAQCGWIVAGDFEPDAITELLTDLMSRAPTRGRGEIPPHPSVTIPEGLRITLIHKSGAAQAVVRVGHAGVARRDPDYDALVMWNQVLGGQFSARLNEVLREKKGYTYGVRSHFDARSAAGPFWIGSALQADRLGDALRDLRFEVEALLCERPPTSQELNDARRSLIESQARHFETPAALVSRFAHLFIHELPPDHHARLPERLEAIGIDDIVRAATARVRPDHFCIAVAGDAQVVGPQLEALGWATVVVEDAR